MSKGRMFLLGKIMLVTYERIICLLAQYSLNYADRNSLAHMSSKMLTQNTFFLKKY